jgi:hypothetical protein
MAFDNIHVSQLSVQGKYKFFNLLGYEPNPGQKKLHDSSARFRVLKAASRVGKSTGAAFEAMAYAHLPKKVIWVVAPTYDLTKPIFDRIWRTLIEERKYETTYQSYRDRIIRLAWGTEIQARSTQNPDSLLGAGVDAMFIDEAVRIPGRIYHEYLRQRVTDKRGLIVFTSSPKGMSGWFPEIYKRGQNNVYKNWFSATAKLTDNPLIHEDEIEELKLTLPEDVYKQEVEGEFVPYGGLVYKEWSNEVHVSNLAEYIPDVPVLMAIDYGTRNPCAVLFMQRVGECLFNIFDEYYMPGKDTVSHTEILAPRIAELTEKSKNKQIFTYPDPAGLDETKIFQRFIPQLVMVPSVNDIEPGINTVRWFLGQDAAAGRPRLLVHPRCTNTIWEMGIYHYPERREGTNAPQSELPVDIDNHAVAALRYILHTMHPAGQYTFDVSQLDSDFSDDVLSVQEAGHAYYDEILTLKSAIAAETSEEDD